LVQSGHLHLFDYRHNSVRYDPTTAVHFLSFDDPIRNTVCFVHIAENGIDGFCA